MVGPPSEELNCLSAMNLRIQWSTTESPPLPVKIIIRVGSHRVRRMYCAIGRFKQGYLHDEQINRSSTDRLQSSARRP